MAAGLVATVLAFSGCINLVGMFQQPTPTPAPVVTVNPTTTPPTVTPAPTPVVQQMSTDVKIMPFGDKGIISFDSLKVPNDDMQVENITVVIANDGDTTAKNVVMTLTETDAHGGNVLNQQTFKIGDIKKGERKECDLMTDPHNLASSILFTADLRWGENGEYYNPTKFINIAKSIIWMLGPQGPLG